ncbi:hypothetical protein DFH09DRAFT_1289101 [Mycena vulgaris]|nr:hypothetical protein DFH09DRAFT_1289101 [Mycena vulgaris]
MLPGSDDSCLINAPMELMAADGPITCIKDQITRHSPENNGASPPPANRSSGPRPPDSTPPNREAVRTTTTTEFLARHPPDRTPWNLSHALFPTLAYIIPLHLCAPLAGITTKATVVEAQHPVILRYSWNFDSEAFRREIRPGSTRNDVRLRPPAEPNPLVAIISELLVPDAYDTTGLVLASSAAIPISAAVMHGITEDESYVAVTLGGDGCKRVSCVEFNFRHEIRLTCQRGVNQEPQVNLLVLTPPRRKFSPCLMRNGGLFRTLAESKAPLTLWATRP